MARKPVRQESNDRSKSERVYLDLRRRIRELALPPGSRLNKHEIALEYSMSRAPVSEAIARLAEEGLVDVYPQSGSYVSPIRHQDIRDSLLIRTGLEVEAARRVATLADDDLLRRLDDNLRDQERAVRSRDMVALDELDAAFHAIIFDGLDSNRAQRLLDQTRAMLDRSRFHALPGEGRPSDTVDEHRRVLDAIRAGDPELAAAAMRVHLAMVSRAIEQDFAEMETQADPSGRG